MLPNFFPFFPMISHKIGSSFRRSSKNASIHFFPWLVVWLPSILHFPINIGLRLSSQLTNSYFSEGWLFFRGVAKNHQPPTSFPSSRTGLEFAFPQSNGDVFAFTEPVNSAFQHGVPRGERRGGPRISVILWGRLVEGGTCGLLRCSAQGETKADVYEKKRLELSL